MIRFEGLKKSFGELVVLNGIDVEICQGRITAIIGPNGSGKSTLIKCVLGLITPDEGTIHIGPHQIGKNAAYKSVIGYMPQHAEFPENITVGQLVAFLKELRHSSEARDEELFEILHLDREINKKIKTLSGGTRQKVNAYLAFLFNPRILILDESTAGLDPVSSSHLKDKILSEKRKGKSIILTSHIMSELEELAEEVIFLLDGRVRFHGSMESLKLETGEERLERSVAQIMKGTESWAR